MSLKSELSSDRAYIQRTYEANCLEPRPQYDLREVAIELLRYVLAPAFRQLHYQSDYRQATVLNIFVKAPDNQDTYTLTAFPRVEFSNDSYPLGFERHHYSCIFDSFSVHDLWNQVIEVSGESDWEIKGKKSLKNPDTYEFTLDLSSAQDNVQSIFPPFLSQLRLVLHNLFMR